MFTISVNGSYPPDPIPPRPQIYREALADFDTGQISAKDLEKATRRAMVDVVGEMIVAGVEVVSDGWIRWEDSIISICGRLGGFELQPGKMPKVVERIKWIKPLVTDDYRFLAARSPVDVRPALIGPFTLARSCIPEAYDGNINALTRDLARALNRELIGLEAAGAKYVSIEEPAIVKQKDGIANFIEASRILLKDVRNIPMLITYGGDLFGIEEDIATTGFPGIGIDLIEGPDNDLLMEKGSFGSGRIIQAGIVDAASDEVEDENQIIDVILRLSGFHDPGLIWVSPHRGLRTVLRETAFAKLDILHSAVIKARREVARREKPGGIIEN